MARQLISNLTVSAVLMLDLKAIVKMETARVIHNHKRTILLVREKIPIAIDKTGENLTFACFFASFSFSLRLWI